VDQAEGAHQLISLSWVMFVAMAWKAAFSAALLVELK
jgi:hypothetical protein